MGRPLSTIHCRLRAGCLLGVLTFAAAAPRAGADEGGSDAGSAPAFRPPTFADDTLMYVFGPAYRNPFTTTPSQPHGADISGNALEFKHVDAWRYGHNLVEIIIKKASDVEPAAGGGEGVMGLYAILRSGVGINRLASAPVVAIGPLRDIAVQAGLNLETKNSDYAPQERTLYLGPSFQFRVGGGSGGHGRDRTASGTFWTPRSALHTMPSVIASEARWQASRSETSTKGPRRDCAFGPPSTVDRWRKRLARC